MASGDYRIQRMYSTTYIKHTLIVNIQVHRYVRCYEFDKHMQTVHYIVADCPQPPNFSCFLDPSSATVLLYARN